MLRVEELCSIFKNLHPHKRIELMCGLMQYCVPLELRFIGSYVENLGRRDFHYLREYEIKANSCAEISKLFKANEDVIRRKLVVYISLLRSSNSMCSKLCFDLLISMNTYLIRAYASPLTYTKSTLDVMLELLTVLVMAINHPAFTFEQRSRLFEIYRWLEARSECLLPVSMEKQFQGTEVPPVDHTCVNIQPSESVPVEEPVVFARNIPETVPGRDADGDVFLEPIGNPFFHHPEEPLPIWPSSPVLAPENRCLSSECWPRPELGTSPSQVEHEQFFQYSPQKVFIKRVEVTGYRKTERKQEFQMQVTWSNGETSEVYKSYQELYDFHTRLVHFYPEDASVHRQDRKLPFLLGNPHLSAREDYVEQTSNTITNYFRKLVSLENDILGCDIVLDFLHKIGSPSPAFPMSPSSGQSPHTSPICPQQDVDVITEICGSNSIIITRASPLRDVPNSSSDNSPVKPTLASRSPFPRSASPNHQQPLPVMQKLINPTKDSQTPSTKNTDRFLATGPSQDDNSSSPENPKILALGQELFKTPPDSRSPSPNNNASLPTIKELLKELQLTHYKETFSHFTVTQLLNFEEEDLLLLKLTSHAQKRLKTKLKQLGRGKLLNGFRGESSKPFSDPTQPRLPPDTLYTSTVSLGQLTNSDNGNSSRDSSPPVSPRQLKTMQSPDLQAKRPISPPHSPVPHVAGSTSPRQVNTTQMSTCNMQQSSPRPGKQHQLNNLKGVEPVSPDEGKIHQIHHISPRQVNAANTPSLSSKTENTEDKTDLQLQSSHVYPTADRLEPPSGRPQPPTVGTQSSSEIPPPSAERLLPPSERLQHLDDNKSGTQEGYHQFLLNPFQGPIQEPIPPVALSSQSLEPVAVEINRVASDVVPNKTSQSEEPCEIPPNSKPIELSSPMYHTGFMLDHGAAYPHRPNYPPLFPQMYPFCAPQPAHLPRHWYNNLPLPGEHQIHCKRQVGKPYLQTHNDPIANKVMTVTVNSAAYRPPFTDCPPSSSPGMPAAYRPPFTDCPPSSSPVTSTTSSANLSRSMSIVNPPGAATCFTFPTAVTSPITYSNLNLAQLHHMKSVNSQSSNGDSPSMSLESVNFGATQHINTSIGGTQQSSQTPVINFHSSCTSCGCRGQCGVSLNHTAAYRGYVHHQVCMPPVVHLPAYPSSNSNGLLPSPCLPPNCQLPFAVNPVPNGITPEQMAVHGYLSHATGQAPNLLNRVVFGYNAHNNAVMERDPKGKPLTCYNCGESGHEASDCKDTSIESSLGQYCLNFKPD